MLLEEEEEEVHNQNVYSNFYIKLPNGNWLVRYRTRDEKILNYCEMMSYMI
jgi:hypothetical protein